MSTVVLYATISLDGKLARPDGGLDWLPRIDPARRENDGFSAFYAGVDALVMGRATFDQVRTFGAWPHPDRPCYVFSHHALSSLPMSSTIQRVCEPVPDWLARMDRAGYQRIWLVGGGKLAADFFTAGCVDEMILTLVPEVLGEGIGIFAGPAASSWQLQQQQSLSGGLFQLHYSRKQ
ncbi:dihydrofolate reductase family protein [Silvimonas amylolytica]|uniref:Riboflavin biosynthesis protein RibD n=1 Tax=Silvimonas amylolytica TaxID=449663 RepID=A0ABQ2PGG3_9NEIS|nr:dihydrofolate reductase family protein [Silvimonas amylolytica]GGP24476.1 riboflavin biosynthesis protein RibD [Silvimonas amylolytica]